MKLQVGLLFNFCPKFEQEWEGFVLLFCIKRAVETKLLACGLLKEMWKCNSGRNTVREFAEGSILEMSFDRLLFVQCHSLLLSSTRLPMKKVHFDVLIVLHIILKWKVNVCKNVQMGGNMTLGNCSSKCARYPSQFHWIHSGGRWSHLWGFDSSIDGHYLQHSFEQIQFWFIWNYME